MKELIERATRALGINADPQTVLYVGIGIAVALLLVVLVWLASRRAAKNQASRPAVARRSVFDQLGLSVFERRLVMAIFVVLFAVLQWWFVFPEFKKWGKLKAAMAEATETIGKYQPEIDKLPAYKTEVAKLEDEGSKLASYDVAIQLLRIVQSQVAKSGVQAQNYNPGAPRQARGNDFFEEQSLSVSFYNTGDKELLDFLVALSADNSMFRVRELTVRHDQSGSKLMGSVTVVATYQKVVAARTVSTTPTQRKP
ncbi:MAG: hypothetical protein HY300_04265 [Verrucomicrobia bacterium]|nr:hypothetical protein [Verrucomicrobiota bacterium]